MNSPNINEIKARSSSIKTDVHFRALAVMGCERSSTLSRSQCKLNCCDGENCLIWLEMQFRILEKMAHNDIPALLAYISEIENERLRDEASP